MEALANNLNPQQKEAILDNDGPLLVISGPGSGKTTILTRRIARLLSESQGQKYKILALTFTKKAANEMKERVELLVGEETTRLYISTFHGFCFDVLRKYGSYIGLNNEFTLYDQSAHTNDYIEILIEAVQEELAANNLETYEQLSQYIDAQLLRNKAILFIQAISKFKNQLKGPDDIPENSRKYDQTFKLIYKLYNQKLRNSNVIDYGDLLFLTYRLFKEKPFIAKQYRRVFKHLLIDEAQDTNRAQLEVIKAFCGDSYENIFIVADEDQLIYEWNDAKFEYLLEFIQTYNTRIIQMFENYRCPQSVLKMANELIKLNVNRLDSKKDLIANKPANEDEIFLNGYETVEDESIGVMKEIIEINDFNNTCVIARNRSILKIVEKHLKASGIPYNYPSTGERFSSKEAQILLSILHAVFNENDKIHINYLCDYYSININELVNLKGQTLFNQFIDALHDKHQELTEVINYLLNRKIQFLNYIETIFEKITAVNFSTDERSDENKIIFDDLEQLRKIIKNYSKERDEEERSIGDFLSFLALSPKGDQSINGVTLLTGHAAKGLEFDYVFIVSVNQGVFPDFRSLQNTRALEEERRNFFVALTRTKKTVYLSYSRFKNTRFGFMEQAPSQFLKEIGVI